MGTTDVLTRSVRNTHHELGERLEKARAVALRPDEPRRCYALIDAYLAATSRHLHAVDAVLVPVARRSLPDGRSLVHEHVCCTRELEVVLAHVKAHEYGSVYETSFAWPDVWDDVRAAAEAHRDREIRLADELTRTLDDEQLHRLTGRLRDTEQAAPSRPHPYVPHTGLLGLVARKVMCSADRFWDTVEGRMIPEPTPAPKKPPGLLGQYLLGDPRFEEEPLSQSDR